MICDPEVLRWKWSKDGCRISTSGGQIIEWDGCAIKARPTPEEYAAASAEYAADATRAQSQQSVQTGGERPVTAAEFAALAARVAAVERRLDKLDGADAAPDAAPGMSSESRQVQ